MKRVLYDLKIIGGCLLALYIVSLAAVLAQMPITGVFPHAGVLAVMFTALAFGAYGILSTKEWARQLLIYVNLFMAFYLSVLYVTAFSEISSSAYVLLSLIVALFLNQSKVRARFVQKKGSAWRSILVVDDDESVIKIVRPILMSNGFSVLTASSGEEGLQIARKQQPDLIILDVILPKMKGREVCQQLKEDSETQHIPVVFLTAKDSEDDIHAEMEAGAVAHLTKPINARELAETVSKILN